MSVVEVLFGLLGLVALGSALLVVTTRHLVHAALWLVVTLGAVAGCYLLLSAEFVAWVQVLIYVGAVVVLAVLDQHRCAGEQVQLVLEPGGVGKERAEEDEPVDGWGAGGGECRHRCRTALRPAHDHTGAAEVRGVCQRATDDVGTGL